ncbi:hypothetical protein TYRP_009277 [Tyrophagus putrescentiae]|nr:hypothetical protein TYRP_009277 [Tyrophagus putrescentiae]
MLLFPVYECSRKQKSTAKLFLLLLLFLALSQTLSAKGCCNKKLVPSAVNRTGSKLKKVVLPSCTVFTLGLGLGLFFLPPFGGDNVIRQVFKDIVSHFPREVPSLKREKDDQPIAPPPPPLPPPPPSPEDNPSKKSWYQKPMVQVLLVVLVALIGLALLVYYWPFLNAAYIFLVNRYLLGYPFDPAAAAAATAAAFAAAETGGSTSGGGASGSAGGGGGGDQGAPAGAAAAAAAAGAMPPEGSTSTSNNNSSSSSSSVSPAVEQQQQQQEPQLQFLHPIPPVSPAFDGPIWRDPPRTPLLIPRDAADPRQLAEYHHSGGPSPKKPKRRSREQQQQHQHQQKYHFGTPVPPSHP